MLATLPFWTGFAAGMGVMFAVVVIVNWCAWKEADSAHREIRESVQRRESDLPPVA